MSKEKENCECGRDCDCEKEKNCHCDDEKCDCDDDCKCNDKCDCEDCDCDDCDDDDDEKCKCGDKCDCDDEKDCGCHGKHDKHKKEKHKHHDEKKDKNDDYLVLARQIQADFENFRRHALDDIKAAKTHGQISVIEVFLPCLDTFKDAKKSITDKNVLAGIEMIENKILSALESLGVKKIQTIGEEYNPHIHEGIAFASDPTKDDGKILDEYQAGYVFNGKVIRYSKVIVNKLS